MPAKATQASYNKGYPVNSKVTIKPDKIGLNLIIKKINVNSNSNRR